MRPGKMSAESNAYWAITAAMAVFVAAWAFLMARTVSGSPFQ